MPRRKNFKTVAEALGEVLYKLVVVQKLDRSNTIGGTDAARLVKGDWKNLYYEKKGIQEPDDLSNVLPVQMGIYTENFNRTWYEKETKNSLSPSIIIQSIDHPMLTASLDAVALNPTNNQVSVWDAKHTNAFSKAEKLFERYYPQMQHYMMVSGIDNAILSVFYGNMKWEELHIAKDEDFQWSLLKAELMFLHMMDNEQEPPDHMDWDNFRKEKYNDKGNISVSILS